MMAGVPPTGIVTEKVRLYKIKHNTERNEYECDIPLLIKEWPHAARRLNIMEICDSTPYCIDRSKIGGKVRAGAVIHV